MTELHRMLDAVAAQLGEHPLVDCVVRCYPDCGTRASLVVIPQENDRYDGPAPDLLKLGQMVVTRLNLDRFEIDRMPSPRVCAVAEQARVVRFYPR